MYKTNFWWWFYFTLELHQGRVDASWRHCKVVSHDRWYGFAARGGDFCFGIRPFAIAGYSMYFCATKGEIKPATTIRNTTIITASVFILAMLLLQYS
ncbi:hypothetical protein ABFS82_13G039500 [Erythranthe guttata]